MREITVCHDILVDVPDDLPELNLGGPCPLDCYGGAHDCDHCVVVVLHFDGRDVPQRFTCQTDLDEPLCPISRDKDGCTTQPVPERYISYRTSAKVTHVQVMSREHTVQVGSPFTGLTVFHSHDPFDNECLCWDCLHPDGV